MTSVKVAVFGIYDSRGGTWAVPFTDKEGLDAIFKEMDDNQQQEMEYGCKEYGIPLHREWVPNHDPNEYGVMVMMEVPAPEEGDKSRTASRQQFQFVAELHYEVEPPEGELELDWDGTGAVLRESEGAEESTFDPEEYERQRQIELKMSPTEYLAHQRAQFEREFAKKMETLENPVQLEYIELQEGWDADIEEREKKREEYYKGLGVHSGWDSRWTEEQSQLGTAWREEGDEFEKEREARLASKCKFIRNPTHPRWDDDGCAFVLTHDATI